jgi:hypothetical protein
MVRKTLEEMRRMRLGDELLAEMNKHFSHISDYHGREAVAWTQDDGSIVMLSMEEFRLLVDGSW